MTSDGKGARPRFRRRARLLLVAMGILAGLALAEAAIRVCGLAPAIRPIYLSGAETVFQLSDNPILGYDLKRNYRNPNRQCCFGPSSTNSHGLRDVERRIEKPTGVRRVILLGDSVVMSMYLSDVNLVMHRQLEGLYPDGKTEVLNFGIEGYNTLAEVELLRVRGLQFKPDVVVVLFVWNDFCDWNSTEAVSQLRPARSWLTNGLFRYSHAFRYLAVKFNLFGFGADYDPLAASKRAIGGKNVSRGLRMLREMADKNGFQPLVAIWPEFKPTGVADLPTLPDSKELVIERLASAEGIPTFRLSPVFERAARSMNVTNPAVAFAPDQMHPNELGSRVAAAGLKEALDRLPELQARAREQASSRPAAQEDVERIAAEAIPQRARGTTLVSHDYVDLGEGLAKLEDMDRAAMAYREALEIDPANARAYCGLAKICMHKNAATEALRHYDTALKIDPGLRDARTGRAESLIKLNRVTEAAAVFEAMIREDPRDYRVLASLAIVYAMAGNRAKAIDAAEKSLAVYPDQPRLRRNLLKLRQEEQDAGGKP